MKLQKIFNQDTSIIEKPIQLDYDQKSVNEKTIIQPLIFVGGKNENNSYKDVSVPTPTLGNLPLTMFSDANLEILARKNFENSEYINYDLKFNNSAIISDMIINSIREMATINFYSFYDNSTFGSSEIGSFFDIKRKFYDYIYNNHKIKMFVAEFITHITNIYETSINDFWNKDYIKDFIESGGKMNIDSKSMISDSIYRYIENIAIQITMIISTLMSRSIIEGLSSVLCDVISTPNINTIFNVIINSDNNLKELYNDPSTHDTFGEIATCHIAQYYINSLYDFCQNIICKNIFEILFSSIMTFWFVYNKMGKNINKENLAVPVSSKKI